MYSTVTEVCKRRRKGQYSVYLVEKKAGGRRGLYLVYIRYNMIAVSGGSEGLSLVGGLYLVGGKGCFWWEGRAVSGGREGLYLVGGKGCIW